MLLPKVFLQDIYIILTSNQKNKQTLIYLFFIDIL